MKTLTLIFLLIFLSACTSTKIVKHTPEGQETFKASNVSVGWDRENVTLDLLKTKEETALQVGIGKSGGSEGLKRAIKLMEGALEALKGSATPLP